MSAKLKMILWRMALVIMTVSFWVSLIAAQDEVETATEATNLGPIWAILLAGLGAVAGLGLVMSARDRSESNDNNS